MHIILQRLIINFLHLGEFRPKIFINVVKPADIISGRGMLLGENPFFRTESNSLTRRSKNFHVSEKLGELS